MTFFKPPENRPPYDGNFLYDILSLYIPSSLILGILSPALKIGIRLLPPFAFPPAVTAVAVIASGIAASLYFALIKGSGENHAAGEIRGAVIAAAAAYIAASLPPHVSWGRKFLPAPANVLSFFSALFMWFGTLNLKRAFAGRELPERHMREHDGESLAGIMLEDAPLIAESDMRLSSWGRTYGAGLVLSWILIMICAGMGLSLSPFFFLLFICVTVNAFWIFAFLGSLRREHYIAGEGMSFPEGTRAANSAVMFCFLAATALAAAVLAYGKNLLPLSLIADFLAWLRRLFDRPAVSGRTFSPPPDIEPAPIPLLPPGLIQGVEIREPWPGWDWLKKGALVLSALLFVYFMIRPLLTLKGKSRVIEKLGRIIILWLTALRVAAARLFALFLAPGPAAGKPAAGLRRVVRELDAAYSPEKRQAMRKSMGIFARLVVWGGERYGVEWKASLGPGEYCGLLAAAAEQGEIPGAVRRCGELFEEALYAPAVFPSDKQKEFRNLAETIMSA